MILTAIFSWIQHYFVQHSILAPVVYVVLHVLFAIFLIPCSAMTVIAGVLWGKGLGLGISIFSAFLSSTVTFGLARRFLKIKVYSFLVKRYSNTDWFLAQTKIHGWKFIASVQLNPAAPASAFGYLFGLSGIEFRVYAVFSLLFMLPLQLLLVFAGNSFYKGLISNSLWLCSIVILISIALYIFIKKFNPRVKLGPNGV